LRLDLSNLNTLLDCVSDVLTVILVFLLGTLDQRIGAFYAFLAIDIALGVYLAIKAKEFSKKYFICKSIEKLIFYTIAIAVGHLADTIGKYQDQIRGLVLVGLFMAEWPSFSAKMKKIGMKKEAEIIEKYLPKQDAEERSDEK
jgi:phage-related holin